LAGTDAQWAHQHYCAMTLAAFQRPDHWRQRAEEIRAIADSMKDATAQKMLFKIATDYETLAVRAEIRLLDEGKLV
jgi:hypothetical protein